MPVSTVDEYLAALPKDRRDVIASVRDVVNRNLPSGYEEGVQYGMIGWYVPKSIYPAGYHANPKLPLPYIHLASQKSHHALYLMCVYGDPELSSWFIAEYERSGKRLDMGKSCVRFKKLDDLPLDVIGRAVGRVTVAQFIASYEAMLGSSKLARRAAKSAPTAKR